MSHQTPEHFIATASDEVLGELIPSKLFRLGMEGSITRKYGVREHPDLLVRYYGSHPSRSDELQQANKAVHAMTQYGIAVPTSRVFCPPSGEYLLTLYVEGNTLERQLQAAPFPTLISQTDEHFAKLGNWLVEETKKGEPTVTDVYGADQWMVGLAGTHPSVECWLTDFPEYNSDDSLYLFNVRHLAMSILDAEQIIQRRLTQARLALERTIAFVPEITDDTEEPIAEIHHALETDTTLHDER